ncbi:hypothetical protein SASPL_100359 [Salvia splendens]|uniref:Beta-amylase n=1 Tax=Salvia splendens TaxID=180675 RepID=A0A8X8YSR3_SALSN|nr:hypothetical protein SASPL_100359 [Salvia splendens]
MAASTFSDDPVSLSGKIPLVHSWSKARSHPSELTAGFYNTSVRDGYGPIVEMFSRNSCQVILPGFDLSDDRQPTESWSSQETLVISKNLTGENAVANLFTYQRMGAEFFSPEHFPRFTQFVRGLNEPAPNRSLV